MSAPRPDARRAVRTEDGYTFYLQPDGTLTDTPDPADADMTYDSLTQVQDAVDVTELPAPPRASAAGCAPTAERRLVSVGS